jgi:nicotinamide-nucleotide amidase
VRCDVLAIGTELLLGQIVDTNSAWIGEQLTAAGIDTCEHRKVGDNLARMTDALRGLLHHADAVIVCGGLGPTPDDVTREAVADLMGAPLERRADLVEQIAALFGARGRDMPANNLRQADVPKGGDVIPNPIGTAPGLRCELDLEGTTKVVYAVPGVPYEMQQMVTDHVLPDLLERSGERAVIVSRSLKTWGTSESALAEMIADRVENQTNPTIAFLARGIEGLYVRITAKASTQAEAHELIDRRPRVRRRRRDDGARRAHPPRGAWLVPGCRRIAHRRPHRRPHRRRPRRERRLPRLDHLLRHRRQA